MSTISSIAFSFGTLFEHVLSECLLLIRRKSTIAVDIEPLMKFSAMFFSRFVRLSGKLSCRLAFFLVQKSIVILVESFDSHSFDFLRWTMFLRRSHEAVSKLTFLFSRKNLYEVGELIDSEGMAFGLKGGLLFRHPLELGDIGILAGQFLRNQ